MRRKPILIISLFWIGLMSLNGVGAFAVESSTDSTEINCVVDKNTSGEKCFKNIAVLQNAKHAEKFLSDNRTKYFVFIDCEYEKTYKDIIKQIQSGLGFYTDCSDCKDAFAEVIRDLWWIPFDKEIVIYFNNFDALQNEIRLELKWLIDCLDNTVIPYWKAQDRNFSVYILY